MPLCAHSAQPFPLCIAGCVGVRIPRINIRLVAENLPVSERNQEAGDRSVPLTALKWVSVIVCLEMRPNTVSTKSRVRATFRLASEHFSESVLMLWYVVHDSVDMMDPVTVPTSVDRAHVTSLVA